MTKTLVVEDDMDIREFVALVLGRAGHEVATARDGREGLEMLSAEHYDIVVVDHHMPWVTGAELLGQLASVSPGTRAVMMSGDHDVRFLEPVVQAQPVFLPKPFNRLSLMSAVESLVGSSVS